jgi:hypothetical protein
MMSLFLGQRADAVDEVESSFEIGKRKRAEEMMLHHDVPFGNFRMKRRDCRAVQRRHATPARDAFLVG